MHGSGVAGSGRVRALVIGGGSVEFAAVFFADGLLAALRRSCVWRTS